MKVLLLEEYSGFHTNLKRGLLELGVDCKLASSGDGWKKIEGSDFSIGNTQGKNKIETFQNRLVRPLINIEKLHNYDVVQMVDSVPFSSHLNKFLFNSMKKHNGKIFVSVAGGCCSLFESYKKGDLSYYIYDDNPDASKRVDPNTKQGARRLTNEKYVYEHVDGIIPIMYEYAVGVRKYPNCRKTIPLPFDSTGVSYTPNIIDGKIRIAHGIIREKWKGTSYIKEAMEIIQNKYPNDVEIMLDGKMPLNDYLAWLRSANILIDQCKEHCYGLNALYAMAEGRIVLGGASENSLKELGVDTCPVYHIEPNVDQIVTQLEFLIEQKHDFERIGYESRIYVESVHNHIDIAQRYIDTWKNK